MGCSTHPYIGTPNKIQDGGDREIAISQGKIITRPDMKILKFKISFFKSLFCRNSAVDCPMSVKFCTGKQNSIATEVR